jgi:hypothetical protein
LADGRETGVASVDAQLLNRVAERIARGLYFHEMKTRWLAPLAVLNDFLVFENLELPPLWPAIVRLRHLFSGQPRLGTNREVFFYQWSFDRKIIHRCFYEGPSFVVCVIHQQPTLRERGFGAFA